MNKTADKLEPLGSLYSLLTRTTEFFAASETKFTKIFMDSLNCLGLLHLDHTL